MRASLAQYTNEFVSLAIMALMAIALIAGQAGAAQHTVSEPTLDAQQHVIVVDIDLSFRQERE